MNDEIGRYFAEIGKDRVEGSAVAVNVRYNRDSHLIRADASN
jgi:hypothetical protein